MANRGANRTKRRGLDGIRARAFAKFGFVAPLKTSVLLTRGAGAASFTRATVATVTDFEGCCRNVLSGEVRFQNARRVRNFVRENVSLWHKANLGTGVLPVVTAGQTDPEGGATAYRVQLDRGAGTTAGDYSFTQDGPGTGITTGRSSIWIKSNTGLSQTLSLRIATGNAMNIVATASWQRLSPPANSIVYMDLGTQGNLATSAVVDVLVWRPMLEDVTSQSNQNPSEYVSVGAAKRNELIYTEEFDNAAWTKVSATVTANQIANPLTGHVTADKMVESVSASSEHSLKQSFTKDATARQYKFSAYLKYVDRPWVYLLIRNGLSGAKFAGRYFNIQTGAMGGALAATWTNDGASITDVGDGWYLCSVTFTTDTDTTVTPQVRLADADGNAVYNGDGASSAYVYGASCRLATASDTYFPVGNVYSYPQTMADGTSAACVDGVGYSAVTNPNRVSANVVYSDVPTTSVEGYVNGSRTNGRPRYLPEGTSTNLVLQSSTLNTTWTKSGTPVCTEGAAYCGDIPLTLVSDDDAGVTEYVLQNITFTADAAKSVSILVKQGTSTYSLVYLRDTTASADRLVAAITWSAGVPVITCSTGSQERPPEPMGNGVWRIFMLTASVTAANTNALRIYPATDGALSATPTGTIYVGGVQAENATFASSHQPTTTGTAARNADFLRYPAAGNVASEGAMYSEFQPYVGATSQVIAQIDDGSNANILASQLVNSTNTFQQQTLVESAVTGDVQTATALIPIASGPSKGASVWGADDFDCALNGVKAATPDTSGAVPSGMTVIGIGARTAATAPHYGPIGPVMVAQRKLSDAEFVGITR